MQRFDPAFDETKETFVSIDRDGSGTIELDEFKGLMFKIDHSRSEGALRVQFAAIDTDHDGQISEAEFRAWLRTDGSVRTKT